MKNRRVIPRFDVKGPNVVKGIQLEGLRVVGQPGDFARKYFAQGADEIIYIDIVASLYERNNLLHVIEEATELGVAIPMTVGGGIRNIEDIRQILRAGADKVAINTAATRRPEFVTEAARTFGSQCIVGSVQAKRLSDGKWEAYIDNGRERTGRDAVAWACELVRLGAGELLVTSVDREGTRKGYDIELIQEITSRVSVPVIAGGGAGSHEDIYRCLADSGCDAVSFATLLHYDQTTITDVKADLAQRGVPVRLKENQTELSFSPGPGAVVSVIDYGLGNLRSVRKAFEALNHPVRLIRTPEELENAELLVLPGVGAFADGMAGLERLNLIDATQDYAASGKPLLGICLGMQLMMSESQEFGHHEGLDLIPGKVIPFNDPKVHPSCDYFVPHVGWNAIQRCPENDWQDTILEKTANHTNFYFVHSYKVMPESTGNVLAVTHYGEQEFCSVVRRGNIYGTQFHPERCGRDGLRILQVFGGLTQDTRTQNTEKTQSHKEREVLLNS